MVRINRRRIQIIPAGASFLELADFLFFPCFLCLILAVLPTDRQDKRELLICLSVVKYYFPGPDSSYHIRDSNYHLRYSSYSLLRDRNHPHI